MRIAVIDRRDAFRDVIANCLKGAGHTVSESTDDPNDWKALGETLDLAVVGGVPSEILGLCSSVLEHVTGKGIPVILVSEAFSDARFRAQGLDAGASACLPEPMEPAELAAQLQALLRRQVHSVAVDHDPQSTRKSDELFQATFGLASVGIATAEPYTAKFLEVNDKYCAITGYSPDELRGLTAFDITHPEDRGDDWEIFQRVFRREAKHYRNEKRYVRKDGRAVWVHVNVAVLRDAVGNPVKTVGIIEDITERKEAEFTLSQLRVDLAKVNTELELKILERTAELTVANRQLQQSEQRLKLALTASHMGVWEWAIPTDRIVWSSECVETLPSRSLPATMLAFVGALPQGDGERVLDAVQSAIAGKSDCGVEFRITGAEGNEFHWISLFGRVEFDGSGNPLRMIGTICDITERKRNEEALKLSEERYNAVVAGVNDGVWDEDLVTGKVFMSKQWRTMLGYLPEEIADHIDEFNRLTHPDDLAGVWAGVKAHLTGQTPYFQAEFRMRHKDGTWRWILSKGSALRDCTGRPYRIAGSHTDITDRKRLEEQLRERAEEVEKVMQVAPVAIFVAQDASCHEITGNQMANQLFHVVAGENLSATRGLGGGEPWLRFFRNGRQLKPEELPMQVSAANGIEVSESELELILADDQRIFIWGHASPLFDSSGKVRGCVGAFLDITKRKQADEMLRKLLQAVEQSSAGVVITDIKGRIEFVNHRYSHFTGFSASELIGKNPRIFQSGRTPLHVYQNLWQTILSGKEWQGELLNQTKSGALFWERAIISPVRDEAGAITHFVSVKENVTEQKQAEEALRMSREQLRALAGRIQSAREEERTSMAREIHDVLAQELTLLKMDIQWLIRRTNLPDTDAKRTLFSKELQSMTEATNRAIESVQKIATELRPGVLDSLGLSAAVEWQVKDFQLRTGIACEIIVPEGQLPLDRDRSTALFRILQESLTNVVRHASATRVEICLQREKDKITLFVRDNGCGMESVKLHDPQSIGLLGIRERALLLDGQCQICSIPGQGTTIEVSFPITNTQTEG